VIYRELAALVANGDKVLRILRNNNRGGDVDLEALGHLLEDQQVIVRRINTELKRPKVKTALSIHAPHLFPLRVLVIDKSVRIELLRERIRPLRRHLHEVIPPGWLGRRFGRIDLPDDKSIDKSRTELRKIKAQTEELRRFLVNNFQVHEVI
jgi:hypothetical protein